MLQVASMAPSVRAHPVVKEVFFTLNELVETCVDGQKGYALASADMRDPRLKEYLADLSKQRGEFVIALQRVIRQMGALPENEGSFAGAVHRSWLEARHALGTPDDITILRECERGEKVARERYSRAILVLSKDDIARGIVETVEFQYARVVDAGEFLEAELKRS